MGRSRKKSKQDREIAGDFAEALARRKGTVRNTDLITTGAPELIDKLTTGERKELKEHEEIIGKCIQEISRHAIKAGEHLVEIRDKKLWRENYSGFEDYVERRFDVSPRHGNRWIHYYENSQVLLEHNLDPPKNERENRLLDPVRENKPLMVRVWRSLMTSVKAASGLSARPSRQQIEERVQKAVEASPTTRGPGIGPSGSDPSPPPSDNGQQHDRGGQSAPRRRSSSSGGAATPSATIKVGQGEVVYEVTESYVRKRIFQLIVPQGVQVTEEIVRSAVSKMKDKQLGNWHETGGSESFDCDKVDSVSPLHPVTRLTDLVKL